MLITSVRCINYIQLYTCNYSITICSHTYSNHSVLVCFKFAINDIDAGYTYVTYIFMLNWRLLLDLYCIFYSWNNSFYAFLIGFLYKDAKIKGYGFATMVALSFGVSTMASEAFCLFVDTVTVSSATYVLCGLGLSHLLSLYIFKAYIYVAHKEHKS